jgi:hypothetical protein
MNSTVLYIYVHTNTESDDAAASIQYYNRECKYNNMGICYYYTLCILQHSLTDEWN